MTPREHYQAGQLKEAVAAALESVKKHPTDVQRRGLLCELLCLSGDLERADRQLDTMSQQDPQTAVGISLWRQLIRAETARQEVFTQGRTPEFLGEPSPNLQLYLRALVALRIGQPEEAASLLAQAEETRPKLSGICNGRPFVDFRDLDDRLAGFCEVLTSTGKYYWIPLDRVRVIDLHPPQRPRDLLWRQAYMSVADGPEGEIYLPTIYPGTAETQDPQLQLGRGTTWLESETEVVTGRGLRMFLIGEEDQTILELQHLEFDLDAEPGTPPAASSPEFA
jgi:type VI secretion system protein ImpE